VNESSDIVNSRLKADVKLKHLDL